MLTKNNTVFIPDNAHKQNLPPYQNTLCAPNCRILNIVSNLLRCGLQTNDQYRTHHQRLVPYPLQSNLQREEHPVWCPNLIECRTELDPGKPFLPSF
jgi:hypothetical protein